MSSFTVASINSPYVSAQQKAQQNEDIFLRKTPEMFHKTLLPSLDRHGFSQPRIEGRYNCLDPQILSILTPQPRVRKNLTPLNSSFSLEKARHYLQQNPNAAHKPLLSILTEQSQLLKTFYTQRRTVLAA